MFISFEGLDGCGKSTQALLLKQRLETNGKRVLLLREPGGTKISEKIREILLDKIHSEMNPIAEIFLFSSARAQLVSEIIKPALQENDIVICDRYVDSTTAYQGFGRGISLESVRAINTIATQELLPDVTFFLDIPVHEAIHRRKKSRNENDRMEEAKISFFHNIYNGFLSIMNNEPQRFLRIDGMKSINDIHNEVWNIFTLHFKQ